VFPRATTEDAALDSYQNVLFSIARFHELTGAYPSRVTIVGHAFKRRRFEQLHRLALRWPKTRFAYEGLPLRNEADEREAAAGEVPLSPSISISLSERGSARLILFCLLPVSWPTHILRILRICMVATRRSYRSAQGGTSTCGLMAITSVRRNCASCWSGAPRTANRYFLGRSHGPKSIGRRPHPSFYFRKILAMTRYVVHRLPESVRYGTIMYDYSKRKIG
jgi:hypothetical protein